MVDNIGEVQETPGYHESAWTMSNGFTEKIIDLIPDREKLRAELESFFDGIVVLNGDHEVYEANSKFLHMLGYTREELLKLHVWDWETSFTPEEIKQASGTIRNAQIHFDTTHKRKDGSLVPVEINGRSFPLNDRVWQLCLCRSIDERKKIESDLRISQHNLYETQRIAHIGSWELDLETGAFMCSDEMKRIWDIPHDQVLDSLEFMKQKVHPEDSDKLREAVEGSVERGLAYDIEYRIIIDEGRIRHLHSRSRIVNDPSGKAIRIYGICQDVTEQKKREEERILNEIRLLQTQEIAHIGTYEYNLNTRELWWSDELYRIYGVENKNNTSPEKYLKYVHPEDLERVRSMQALEREDYYIEHRIIRPDGEIRHVLTFVGRHEYRDGERYLIRGTSQDITEQKSIEQEKNQLELKLHHAQKMETIGTLAGGVAHDINNILGIIIGNTELCLDDVPEWNPAHSNLQEIVKAVLRAKEVIRQLLTFSRNIDIKKEPIDIVSVITDSIKFLRSTISKTVELETEINVTKPNIIADPTQINQIILNLCANSAQAMEATGGFIKVKMENITVNNSQDRRNDLLTSGEYIKIVIMDNGPGIPPALHEKVFDPYFTTKEVGKGSGMGLAVVQGIVKKHKGSVNLKSEDGKGATFTILLPVVEKTGEQETGADATISPEEKKILFIDDEVQITKIAARMLESLGYKVEPETNPREALRLFREDPDKYNLVITDMAMPQMNALMLFQEIRNIRTDIPVILSSGHNPLIDEKKAEETGFAAYILKPFTKAELVESVQGVFEKIA